MRRPLGVAEASALRSPLSTELERGLGGEASSAPPASRSTAAPNAPYSNKPAPSAKTPTPAEQLLWQRLRGAQLAGLRVRRQQPIGPFVVDFFVARGQAGDRNRRRGTRRCRSAGA